MNVLFVSSGNIASGIGTIVKNQGDSLIKAGINLSYFTIYGKGVAGYLKNVPKLNRVIRNNKIDLIHAHYSYSAIIAIISTRKPVICSLMGTDIQVKGITRWMLQILSNYFWDITIVKSKSMKNMLRLNKSVILPNGVDLDYFDNIQKHIALNKVAFNPVHKHIVFISNPARFEKNFKLAQESFESLNLKNEVEFHVICNVDYSLIPYYLYAADILLLTSLWEGSPNIIKEAMACNLPIVATDVGDIRENIENIEGCYITGFNPQDVAAKLKSALDFNRRTNCRNVIIEKFDSQMIANKLRNIYQQVLSVN
jgi:teichuronic acid biosynthesis glycosyltransferase TuaC